MPVAYASELPEDSMSQEVVEDEADSVDADNVKVINLNEDRGIPSKTKEEIVQKLGQVVVNPESPVHAEVGSSVNPFKEWVLTDSTKQTLINMMNYYRYLMGIDELGMAEKPKWSDAGKGIILHDIYSPHIIDGELDFRASGLRQQKGMSMEFYLDALDHHEDSYAIQTSIKRERDIVDTFRNYNNAISLDGVQWQMVDMALDPKNGSATFGISDRSLSVECFGVSSFDNPQWNEAVAWPSEGYFPVEEIYPNVPWILIVNPKQYNNTKTGAVKITDLQTGQIYNSTITYQKRDNIMFEPPATDSYMNKKYKVEITGFKDVATEQPVKFEYTIDFFSMKDITVNKDGKEYVYNEYGELELYPDVNVSYRTHIQSFGWEGKAEDINTWKSNGAMSGTSGKAKRLEGINIVVNPKTAADIDLGIQYTTHCQSYGWLPWSANGEMNGTEGEAKRLEAIKIQLTGADKAKYDVYYRVHAQSYGWLGWAKNGAPAGTAGFGKRLEGIQVVVVKKDRSFDQKMGSITSQRAEAFVAKEGSSPIVNHEPTSNTNPVIPGAESVNVAYRTHVQSFGWQGWKYNGQMSGTSGKAKRLEGINIELRNQDCSGDIVYTTHVQTYGWQGSETDQSKWFKNGQMAGTSGEAKRLEAICVNLTGEMSQKYDIYYRVHAQSYGWLGWAKNGAPAGTAGYAKRLEGIQVVLVPKGGAAPGNYQGIVSADSNPYVSR